MASDNGFPYRTGYNPTQLQTRGLFVVSIPLWVHLSRCHDHIHTYLYRIHGYQYFSGEIIPVTHAIHMNGSGIYLPIFGHQSGSLSTYIGMHTYSGHTWTRYLYPSADLILLAHPSTPGVSPIALKAIAELGSTTHIPQCHLLQSMHPPIQIHHTMDNVCQGMSNLHKAYAC